MTLSKQQITLYEAVSNIDSKYIEETITAPIRFTPGAVKRIATAAAIIVLFFSTLNIWENSAPSIYENTPYNPFILSARADNGLDNTLKLNTKLFSSTFGPPQSVIFPGKPTFDIFVEVTNNRYDYWLKVVYNGHTLGGDLVGDDHVILFDTSMPDATGNTLLGITLRAWFEEPTELILTLYHMETGITVQEQILHIEYDSATQQYSVELIKSNFNGGITDE